MSPYNETAKGLAGVELARIMHDFGVEVSCRY